MLHNLHRCLPLVAAIGPAALMAVEASAQSKQVPAPPMSASGTAGAQALTAQQAFDSATALSDDVKQLPAALSAWEALEVRMAKKPKSVAVVRARKSVVLNSLGRFDDATAAARLALEGMPSTDASLREDRTLSWVVIGQAGEVKLDYAGAADAYRHAIEEAPDDVFRLRGLRGSIVSNTFVNPDAALADLARAKEIIAKAKISKAMAAPVYLAESELMLNQGRYQEAKKAASDAVEAYGGFTNKIDPRDGSARSDYALAALKLGLLDPAREYLARAGAGRFTKGSFRPGPEMTVPECGGDDGLKPADAAVVEFTIDPDGKVSSSRPVYAAGGGAAGLAFARKAREWSFKPEDIATLPAFYRYQTRVELRCTTVLERPSIRSFGGSALNKYLGTGGAEDGLSSASRLPQDRATLAKMEVAGTTSGVAYVVALLRIAYNPVAPYKERQATVEKALAAVDVKAPVLARLEIDLLRLTIYASEAGAHVLSIAGLEALLAMPLYQADPSARSIIALSIADSARRSDRQKSRTYLQRVIDDPALVSNDPMRVGAFIRLASLNLSAGEVEQARSAFTSSGLSAQQCAVADAPPQFLSAGGQFPDDAYRFGFEGWTQLEYDISADGKAVQPRVLVAYPPFVFNEGGLKLIRNARFTKSYRPDGGLGCGGGRRNVVFLIPDM